MLTTALAAKLRAEFPQIHADLVTSLALVLEATDQLLAEAGQKQGQCAAKRDFAGAMQFMNLSQAVAEDEDRIRKLVEVLDASQVREPAVQQVESLAGTPVALHAEFDPTHQKPTGFQLQEGPLYSVRTWVDLLVSAASQLLARYPEAFEAAIASNSGLRCQVSRKPDDFRKPKALNDQLFIEAHGSAQSACFFFLRLLETMSLPASTLTIYLR